MTEQNWSSAEKGIEDRKQKLTQFNVEKLKMEETEKVIKTLIFQIELDLNFVKGKMWLDSFQSSNKNTAIQKELKLKGKKFNMQ